MAPWRVLAVQVLPDFTLHVRFADGTEGRVVMQDFLAADLVGTVFAPLQDPAFFARAGVEAGVVTWPGEIDLAPDTMYREIRQGGCYRMPVWTRKAA